MKRLYVSPEVRGFGLGERLVDAELLLARDSNGTAVGCVGLRPIAVVKEAERIGYREMRLDTLPSMTGAIALYQKFGFEPIEPYYETPVIGTIFMRRSLIERSGQESALQPDQKRWVTECCSWFLTKSGSSPGRS